MGDPTLSNKELIGNESQERMGLVISEKHIDTLQKIADRERSPMYTVGDVTGDHRFVFESKSTGNKPMDFELRRHVWKLSKNHFRGSNNRPEL